MFIFDFIYFLCISLIEKNLSSAESSQGMTYQFIYIHNDYLMGFLEQRKITLIEIFDCFKYVNCLFV